MICGQKGAGCTEVANNLKNTMDNSLRLIDSQELYRLTAARMQLSYSDLFEGFNRRTINKDKALIDTMHEYTDEKTIVEGKFAFKALDKSAYKIFLTASPEKRSKHISRMWNITYPKAVYEMARSDNERRKIVKKQLGKNWLDASIYDMTIDTNNMSYEQTAKIVKELIESKPYIKVINQNSAFNNNLIPEIIQGPSIYLVTPDSAAISWQTDSATIDSLNINGNSYSDSKPTMNHETCVKGLSKDTEYPYEIFLNGKKDLETYILKTPRKIPSFNRKLGTSS